MWTSLLLVLVQQFTFPSSFNGHCHHGHRSYHSLSPRSSSWSSASFHSPLNWLKGADCARGCWQPGEVHGGVRTRKQQQQCNGAKRAQFMDQKFSDLFAWRFEGRERFLTEKWGGWSSTIAIFLYRKQFIWRNLFFIPILIWANTPTGFSSSVFPIKKYRVIFF